jgi:hypothetical protein
MIFFNQIINAKGTPSIYEDTLANRPAASSLGRLFVRTDNPYGIYRDQGTSWQQIAGSGGGGSQDWDNVLSLGGSFSVNRTYNFNNKTLDFNNVNYFNLNFNNSRKFDFTSDYIKYFNSSNTNTLLSINFNNGDCAFGDFGFQFNGTHMNVNVSGSSIYFAPIGYIAALFSPHKATLGDAFFSYNGTQFTVDDNDRYISAIFDSAKYLYLDYSSNTYQIGDIDNNNNGTNIKIIDNSSQILLYAGGSKIDINPGYLSLESSNTLSVFYIENGLLTTYFDSVGSLNTGISINYQNAPFIYVGLGDFNNNENNTKIELIDEDTVITLHAAANINFETNSLNFSGAVLSSTSGSTSSQHLVVTINGNTYKIQLRNP